MVTNNTNKILNAVIVEDEPKNAALLKKMLEIYCPQILVCGEANSVENAAVIIKTTDPDIVFLDIEISGGNAFQLLDILQPVKFDIIFVTAYDSYLLKAIKYSALDYIFKPVSIKELIAAVNKSLEKSSDQNIAGQIKLLLQNAASKTQFAISLPTPFGFYVIPVQTIVRCEANGNYTVFYTSDGRSHTASKTMKEYEDILPADIFFRAHHSHLININYINKYHKGKSCLIEMTDKSTIPLAARRRNDFLSIFHQAD